VSIKWLGTSIICQQGVESRQRCCFDSLLTQEGQTLIYASKEVKANKEVVLAACQQDGLALLYSSKELKAGKKVVVAASSNPDALKHAKGNLSQDPKCLVAAKIWDSHYEPPSQNMAKIVMSTRFSLGKPRQGRLHRSKYCFYLSGSCSWGPF
jgi:hypothetical protein